jgi:outer membrane protein TolC
MALIRLQSSGSGVVSGGSAMQESNSMDNSSANSSMGSMSGGINTGSKSAKVEDASMGSAPNSMTSGNSGMGDVLRIRMEINDLENSRAQLIDNRFPLQAELNQLLNRNINEPLSTIDTLKATVLPIDRHALLDSITENNPMLKMLDAEVEALEAQKKMARLEGRPMLGVGVNYIPFSPRMEAGMAMGGEDMVMPMVKLSIPIYRNKYNAMRKEAEFKQQAMRYRRENTVNQLNTQWSVALRDLDDATRRTSLYKTQSELAKQTLNVLMTSYSTDGSDFEDVLKVQQQLLNYQLKMVTAIVDQHLTMAMLENLSATEMNNWAQ